MDRNEKLAVGRIDLRIADHVGWITLDRPPLNVISTSMCWDIVSALRVADDHPDVRVIVLNASGDRAFAAGSDVREHTLEALREHGDGIFAMIHALADEDGKPRIAAVKGICSGGGMELSYACDFVVARADTRFALPEIGIGVANILGSYLMSGHGNPAFALSRALSGAWYGVEEALRNGLIAEILPVEGYETALDAYVQQFAVRSGPALRMGRELHRMVRHGDQRAILDKLKHGFADATRIADYAEGVAAFLEKREPQWLDR